MSIRGNDTLSMKTLKLVLTRIVRAYLSYFPVTDGKKYIFKWARQWLMPEHPVVTFRTKHNFYLKVNLRNVEHQRMYFYGEHDERYEIRNLKRILRPGDVCWDIGANVGFYTCFFASLVGKSGRVVAFEPASQTAELLRENIELNRLTSDQIILVNKAIGNTIGRQQIFFQAADMAEGTASLREKQGSQSELVEVDTLDNLNSVLPVPDLVKIDVEGYQAELFAGGERFFAQHSPMIMAELKDSNPNNVRFMESKLRGLGYAVYEFMKHSVKRCDNVSQSRARNFFMIKDDSQYRSRIDEELRAHQFRNAHFEQVAMPSSLESRLWPTSLEAAFTMVAAIFLFVLPIPHTTTIRLVCLFSGTLMALALVRRHGMSPLPLKGAFALWAIAAVFSLGSAVNFHESLGEIKSEVVYSFLAFFMFYSQTTGKRRWTLWIVAVTSILLLLSLIGVLRWYTSGDTTSPWYLYNGVAAYTTFLVTVLPFVLLFVFNLPAHGLARWTLRAAPLLLVVPAYLTLNRTVWIVIAVLILTMSVLLMFGDGSRKRKVSALVLLTALFGISLFLIQSSLERRLGVQGSFETVVGHTLTSDPRRELWTFVSQEIARKPWQGIGFGSASFGVVYDQWKSKGILHAHNVFLDAGIQMGVLGIAALVFLFAAVLVEYWRLYRSEHRLVQWLGACGIAMVVAVVTRNMTDDFFRRDLALLFWALVGASLGYGHRLLAAEPGVAQPAAKTTALPASRLST